MGEEHMKTLIDTKEFPIENVRIDRTLMKRESEEEFPELMKWAVQLSYWTGDEWVQICRADNFLHEGQIGSHIHTYNQDRVKWIEVSYTEADKIVKETSTRILREKFGQYLELE
jgi:tricorn protease-like protein